MHNGTQHALRESAASRDAAHKEARDRFLRLPEVIQRTGLSRSAVYALSSSGKFPTGIRLTARSVGWLESGVDAWITERIETATGSQA